MQYATGQSIDNKHHPTDCTDTADPTDATDCTANIDTSVKPENGFLLQTENALLALDLIDYEFWIIKYYIQ